MHLSLQADDVVARLRPYCSADCPAAIVRHASRAEERVVRARLDALVEAAAGLPAPQPIIFVGRVLGALDSGVFRDSALYDPAHVSQYRWASED